MHFEPLGMLGNIVKSGPMQSFVLQYCTEKTLEIQNLCYFPSVVMEYISVELSIILCYNFHYLIKRLAQLFFLSLALISISALELVFFSVQPRERYFQFNSVYSGIRVT